MLAVFPTALGWMAILGSPRGLKRLSLGHANAEEARNTIEEEAAHHLVLHNWNPELRTRLEMYATGKPEDFSDLALDLGPVRAFQEAVFQQCRAIPHGKTRTYGELAAQAGYSRAARAVGNCMAANRLPIVIPCHRVIPSGGGLGGYSAPGGTELKRRLLDLEQAQLPKRRVFDHLGYS